MTISTGSIRGPYVGEQCLEARLTAENGHTHKSPTDGRVLKIQYGYEAFPGLVIAALISYGAGISLFLYEALTGTASLSLAIYFLSALLIAAPMALWKFTYIVKLNGNRLEWKCVLRHGAVDAATIERIHPWWLVPNVLIIKTKQERILLVVGLKGFPRLIAKLVEIEPALDIKVGWYVERMEGLPFGWSGYKKVRE